MLAELRTEAPVAWVQSLGGWLVTRYDLALEVMRDPATYTVQDDRFSTAQVIGYSMLSLDGPPHDRHRAPFVTPFRPREVRERFTGAIETESDRLIDGFATRGHAELRREFAGPLAAATMAHALGLAPEEAGEVLSWYRAIVGAVTEITRGTSDGAAGRDAFRMLSDRLQAALKAMARPGAAADEPHRPPAASDDTDRPPAPDTLLQAAARHSGLTAEEVIANAGVLLFGGIETTEGMILNVLLHLLTAPAQLEEVLADRQLLPAAIEESLRLEPAAAVVDRFATQAVSLGDAQIASGDLVRVSIAAANRDPSVFPDPDRFDLHRKSRRHLSFAQGPHVCVGVHLARLETRIALDRVMTRLPSLRLDPRQPGEVSGLVFRKPPALHVIWQI